MAFCRKCIGIRKAHPALQVGDFRCLVKDDAKVVYVFTRRAGRDEVLVVLHNADGAVDVPLPAGRWRDVGDEVGMWGANDLRSQAHAVEAPGEVRGRGQRPRLPRRLDLPVVVR